MTEKKSRRLNRAQRTLALARTGWITALDVMRENLTTTPSKHLDEAEDEAVRRGLRWLRKPVRISDGRIIMSYRAARSGA